MSHISMIKAKYVCPGMVFSTDGYRVNDVIHSKSLDDVLEDVTISCMKNGHQKIGHFAPEKDLPIWVED